jgi:hypothetical protein
MTSNALMTALIAAKFLAGLAAILLGIHTNEPGTIIFGIGHAFILAPLWAYFLRD